MLNEDPERLGFHIWFEFFEDLDISEPDLPDDADCDPDGVTWLNTPAGTVELDVEPWVGR